MTTDTAMPNHKVHEGRNIKRFREMLGIKQDALAYDLGDDWNQQKVSLLEQKETVDQIILERVAKVLKVPVSAIKNFDEDSVINIVTNTVNNSDNATGNHLNYYPTFNPLDKVIELYDEKMALYERMLKEKDEMIARYEQLMNNR